MGRVSPCKMSALIHGKGGLVASSILHEVAAKSGKPTQLHGIKYNVLYPVRSRCEIEDGNRLLLDTLEQWSAFSAQLWNEAIPETACPVHLSPRRRPSLSAYEPGAPDSESRLETICRNADAGRGGLAGGLRHRSVWPMSLKSSTTRLRGNRTIAPRGP